MEDNNLLVKIDYIVKADDIKEERITKAIETFEEEIPLIDTDNKEIENLENIKEDIDLPIIKSEEENINNLLEVRSDIEDVQEVNDVKMGDNNINVTTLENEENKSDINDNITSNMLSFINNDDDYTLYHVHIIKENESIESIASEYKSNKEDILKLNENIEICDNNKLIIPLKDE